MKKIGIIGISGRVGRALYRQCLDHAKYTCTAGYARLTAPDLPLCFSLNDLFISCDYVVDFSSPDLMPDIVKTCLSHPKPLVIGTTGMAMLKDHIAPLAKIVPVVIAPNTSVGACLQRHLASTPARFLSQDYDIDIIDRHHNQKKDQPSGTALALAESIVKAKETLDQCFTFQSPHSPRSPHTIQIASLRSGHIPAEHEVNATNAFESITLTHKVFHRDLFAQGVFTILDWLGATNPSPGMYSMEDVLGL